MNDDPASRVCYAAEGSDAFVGFASRDEIVAALNELLEAERAGGTGDVEQQAPIAPGSRRAHGSHSYR